MSKLIIKLSPATLRMSLIGIDHDNGALANFVRVSLNLWEPTPAFHVYFSGSEAAEEAYDLTNNPARQEEREERYGRGRSVSIGDVVEVDGANFLCGLTGWVEL